MLWGKAWGWSLRVGGIWKVGVCVREREKGSRGGKSGRSRSGLGGRGGGWDGQPK